MLYWASIFSPVSIVAASFGFGGPVAGAVMTAHIPFFLFLALLLAALTMGLSVRRRSETRL